MRSFRKNFAASSSKPPPEKQNMEDTINGKKADVPKNGLFVKINMDGVPIGRKVDLAAYDSYDKLAVAVVELFRGLLAGKRICIFTFLASKSEKKNSFSVSHVFSHSFLFVYG